MHFVRAGACYRQVSNDQYLRVFAVAPDEDLVIVARIKCTSTRLRRLSLNAVNAAFNARTIVPVEIVAPLPHPIAARRDSEQSAFAKIRPALQRLLDLGYDELSKRKLWPDLVSLGAEIDIPAQTLNRAFSNVLMAGGVIEAAALNWNRCGRRASNSSDDSEPIPTNQPGSFPLSAVDFSRIAAGVRRFLRDGNTWTQAHDKFLEAFYPASERIIGSVKTIVPLPPGQRPSLSQFKWHGLRLVPFSERLEQQFGKRIIDTEYRGRPNGQSAYAIYPGVVGEIDWTYTDIVGVARGSRLSVGRFVFYAIADVFSGAISAAYATMYSGKASEAGRAVVQSCEDKVMVCARVGLKITKDMWDIQPLFVELRSDKGEIDSWKSTGLGTALGMKLEHCPSKRPDLKGTIESFFRVLRFFLRRLRGGTSGYVERLKDHPNVTAIYDFDQVQALMFTLAIAFNARVRRRQAMTPGMVASQIKPVPNELYKWAFDRGCSRNFSVDYVRIGALPTHFANVTAEGIKFKGLRFVVQDFNPETAEGIDSNEWLMEARRKSWQVEIGIDPATVNHIWLRHRPPGRRPVAILCPLSEEHAGWKDMSWIEYGLNKEEFKEAIQNYEETQLRGIRAWARGTIAEISTKALAQTAEARGTMSASAQIAGTKERRIQEMAADNNAEQASVPQTAMGTPFFDEAQWGPSN